MTIASLALSAAGAAMQSNAAGKAADARNDALAAERIRQQKLDREADAVNLGARDRYEDFEGQQEEKATTLGDYFAKQTATEPVAAATMPVSSSQITVQEEGKQRAEARDFTDKTGEARGNLRAFGDLLGGIGREQARDAGTIGQIGGFKRGSSGVLPLELDAASQAGSGAEMFGQILGGAGTAFGAIGANPQGLAELFGTSAPLVNSGAKSSALTAGGTLGGSGSNSGLRLGSPKSARKSSARVPFG